MGPSFLSRSERAPAAAQEYLQENQAEGREWRIDLVAIEIGGGGRLKRLDVLENAVEL
jgi:hypothetical protein